MRPDTRRAARASHRQGRPAQGERQRRQGSRRRPRPITALASSPKDRARSVEATRPATPASDGAASAVVLGAPLPGDVIQLAPNIISVKHWDRLLGGLLYAVQPRVDWATLLRRSLSVDVLECPKCHGRLRVVAVITEREPVQRILAHLGLPTEPPPVARARDPTDDVGDDEAPAQLALGLP